MMRKIKIERILLATGLLFGMLSAGAAAQELDSESTVIRQVNESQVVHITQIGLHSAHAWQSGESATGNYVRLYQEGMNHNSFTGQHGMDNIGIQFTSGSDITTWLHQEGTGNRSFMELSGSRHDVSVFQLGDENRFSLEMTGDRQSLNVTQEGNRNRYERVMHGDVATNESVLQIGDDNTSIQIGSLSGGRSASIMQEGSGMELMIRHQP